MSSSTGDLKLSEIQSSNSNPHSPATIGHVLHRLVLAGAEVLAADLARKLKDSYRFIFLCLDELGPLGEQLQAEGFEVINLERRPGIDLSVSKKIRKAVVQHDIKLLHAHQYTPFFYAAMSRGMQSHPRILFTEHGRHYPDIKSLKRVIANKFLLRKHDRATAVGEFVKQALVANERIAPGKIQVVYNGIDPAQHQPDSQIRSAVRNELGVNPDQPVVLQVARFHTVKDHETAIRAFALLLKQSPSAILVLAGDGDERNKIETLVQDLGITDQIKLLGVRNDVPRLMAGCDLFLLSSLSEGISVTLLEAMASKLPIAATDVGGNPEVVEHKATGLLSARKDYKSLAANMHTILSDKDLSKKMGLLGNSKLHKQFAQKDMHQSYANLYDTMI